MPTQPRLSIIAALARNGVIGRANALPWRLSSDLKRFRALTMGHHIVMGRRTYESIGRALPGRISVVVSRDAKFAAPACTRAATLDEALEIAREDSEVFVIGGGELYRAALPRASRMYLTEVQADVTGDTYFPAFAREAWREVSRERSTAGANDEFAADFVIYDRVVA
jgi:dihydrofolate reductase